MNRLVYLFELDSVRNTQAEIEIGQQAMFEEIARNGNTVVLSFNQLTDSQAFIAGIKNKKTYPYMLELFEKGALRVSNFNNVRTPSQYLQNAIEKCKRDNQEEFIFSALPLMSAHQGVLDMVLESLRYSNPSLFTDMIEQKQMELRSNSQIQGDDVQQEIETLDFLERYVRMILFLSTERLSGNRPLERQMRPFSWYLEQVCHYYKQSEDLLMREAMLVLDKVQDELCQESQDMRILNSRSNWVKKFYQLNKHDAVCMAEAIIDLCYNYTIEESIRGVSRHFTRDNLEEFMIEFDHRLQQYWENFRKGIHQFHEVHRKEPMEYSGKLPHWVTAARLYDAHTERPSDEGEPYELHFTSEKKLWKQKVFNHFMKTLSLSFFYIVVLVIIDIAMNQLQDILFESNDTSLTQFMFLSILSSILFGIIGSIISLAPWLPDFMDIFRRIFNYFEDVWRTKLSPKDKAYKNIKLMEKNNENERKRTTSLL